MTKVCHMTKLKACTLWGKQKPKLGPVVRPETLMGAKDSSADKGKIWFPLARDFKFPKWTRNQNGALDQQSKVSCSLFFSCI